MFDFFWVAHYGDARFALGDLVGFPKTRVTLRLDRRADLGSIDFRDPRFGITTKPAHAIIRSHRRMLDRISAAAH